MPNPGRHLDVRLFPDLRINRALPVPTPINLGTRHQDQRQRHDRLHLLLHLRLRHNLGPHDLGARRRDLPITLPCEIDGSRNLRELDVELSD